MVHILNLKNSFILQIFIIFMLIFLFSIKVLKSSFCYSFIIDNYQIFFYLKFLSQHLDSIFLIYPIFFIIKNFIKYYINWYLCFLIYLNCVQKYLLNSLNYLTIIYFMILAYFLIVNFLLNLIKEEVIYENYYA